MSLKGAKCKNLMLDMEFQMTHLGAPDLNEAGVANQPDS